jgi:SAM-dependent methyltransferase
MLACPLCRGTGTPIETISYDAIWESYRRELGVSISEEVKTEHTAGAAATLRLCDSCGLEFFTPKVPGGAAFYDELMATVDYVPTRWAFDAVLRRLDRIESLIDIGCGSGFFLRRVQAARRVGVDPNPAVRSVLTAHGIEVQEQLSVLARREPASFDVACAFEVLEHLDDIETVIEPMREALKPEGRLFVSVPNAERAKALGVEPLDLPPHHISRWRASHAGVIARRFDLELVRIDREPRLWARAAGTAPPLSSAVATLAGERMVRMAGAMLRPGEVGHSLLFEFQRPKPAPQGAHYARTDDPRAAGSQSADGHVGRFLRRARNVARSAERRDAARFMALTRLASLLVPRYVLTDPEKAWFEDEEFFAAFDALEEHNLTADRKYMLRQLLALVDRVPGDTAECGVYRGASSWFICDHFSASPRTHHAFDSFQGLSAPRAIDGSYWSQGDLSESEASARALLAGFDVRFYCGWIPERFAEVATRTFAFVHIDVDLYEPTRDSLEFFYPRLSPGGLIILDDHGFTTCPGATRAADEFMAGRPEPIISLTTGQGLIIRSTV